MFDHDDCDCRDYDCECYDEGYEAGRRANRRSSGSSGGNSSQSGCYVATCVYGSYDCPQVWTLRRFRDDTLAATFLGRAFIHLYYATSPTIVRIFGEQKRFRSFWKKRLDKLVSFLREQGVEDSPYEDRKW